MALLRTTSPHAQSANSTRSVMLYVILATLPGLACLIYFFSWGYLINVLLAGIFALISEAVILALRGRPLLPYLSDNSALLTGVLLGLSLPPLAPWWVTLVAVSFAVIFAKQLYGGLGNNPFNPAMVGYALVLVSFPVAMTTHWATPISLLAQPPLTFGQTFADIFQWQPIIDGYTMATPLDTYKTLAPNNLAEDIQSQAVFGEFIAVGWQWVSLGYLVGGLFLLYKKIITWHIPVSMLLTLALLAAAFGWDPDSYTPVSIHLLAGATMLGAFFIATDPVSAATSQRGKIVYGAGIGFFIYIIRTWGNYPDAVAFAVLLMNFAAPFIDYFTQPRTYGHRKANRGLAKPEDD